MFELEKTFQFEAGHSLEHHDGMCRDPHGHSYTLAVCLRSDTLVSDGSSTNMVIDFNDLTEAVKPMIDQYLEHKWLNDTLDTDSPTAEFIAQWIYNHLKPHIPQLHSISIHETASSRVTFWES